MNHLLSFHKRHPFFLPLLGAALFVLCVSAAAPLDHTFEFNPDEGTDAMKSVLLLKGYSLYGSIWSDQPPLFTAVIAGWFGLFGTGIAQARVLALSFSALLLFALYGIIAPAWGCACATIACLFLVFSASFMQLSVSLMIGIAAFSLAMMSLFCWFQYKERKNRLLLLLSAIFMALSLLIKFLAPFLIPILLLDLIAWDRKKKNPEFRYADTLLWLACFALVFCAIIAAFFHPYPRLFYDQLLRPHLAQIQLPRNTFTTIRDMLFQDLDLVVLTMLALPAVVKQRKALRVPVLWLLVALCILLVHRPIWHHYYLFLSIPLAWLAAVGITRLWTNTFAVRGKGWIKITALILIVLPLALFFLITKPAKTWLSMEEQNPRAEQAALDIINHYRAQTRWMLTDRPMFGFVTRIPAPPEAALISQKRKLDGKLLAFILKNYNPEIILLSRRVVLQPDLEPLLNGTYTCVFRRPIIKTYTRPPTMHAYTIPCATFIPASVSHRLHSRIRRTLWKTPCPRMIIVPGREVTRVRDTISLFLRNDLLAQDMPQGADNE